jgi:hypothetical protein
MQSKPCFSANFYPFDRRFSARGARFGLLSPVLLQSFETPPRFVTDFITTLEIQHG